MMLSMGGTMVRIAAIILLLCLLLPGTVTAQRSGVATTLHNLSVTGPGEIKATTETQICKFCHIPHSAVVPQPLWGHAMSRVEQYEVPEIRSTRGLKRLPQPDGSSRLCLSCHDGAVALGDVAGERRPIRMLGAQYLTPGRRGYIGTDLSGSHPISFVVEDAEWDTSGEVDMGIRPVNAIAADRQVKLDGNGKMQCTTCHDPHSDRFFQAGKVPHFWVKPTVSEVCLTCHELR
jgi:hypothetical protein